MSKNVPLKTFCDHLFMSVVICQYFSGCIIFHSYFIISYKVKITITIQPAILLRSTIPTEMNT